MADDEGSPVGRPTDAVDRLLLGICGAIWLALLAAGVFAFVAMARLASGQSAGGEQRSSWVLYAVIAVSALVILGAIPLLMRARRNAAAEAGANGGTADAVVAPALPMAAPTERIRVFGVDPQARREAVRSAASPALVGIADRMLLRGTASLLAATGLAYIAVAVGAYLLAEGSDTASWVAFGSAGVVTVAMPAVLVFFQRRLGEAVEELAG